MAHATSAELAVLLRRTLSTEEEGAADLCLDIVSEAIDGYVGSRTVAATTKKNVALLAGRRLFELPPGVRQEILGDWQASYADDGLLSESERGLLDAGGAGGTRRPRTASPRTPADIWETTT